MSTKQSIIFAFMIVFLFTMLTAIGMWLHFSMERDIRVKRMEQIKRQQKELKLTRDSVSKLLNNLDEPDKGLKDRVTKQKELADAKKVEVYSDATMPLKRLYEEKKGEIDSEWEKVGTEWKAVYEDWTKRNTKIRAAIEALDKDRVNYAKQIVQEQDLLDTELSNEETNRVKIVSEKKVWEEELAKIRYDSEELNDKINQVARELELASAFESDGKIIFSDPALHTVTVDIGYQHGARKGMIFEVYSGRHNVPVLKGQLQLTDIGATSSRAVVLQHSGRPKIDASSGFETYEDYRYSPYVASGPDDSDPMALEPKKTLRDKVRDIREERARMQGLTDEDVESEKEGTTTPPMILSRQFEPIVENDWISNTEFVRIQPKKEFLKEVNAELEASKDVNLGTLTFYFTDTVRPFRQEFLTRVCERNRCKVAKEMGPDVDYVVTTYTAQSIPLLKRKLDPYKDRVEVSADIANHRKVLEALEKGKTWGARTLTEDNLEAFLLQRQRKSELLKGKVIQPGQYRFYVVGETRQRSVEETRKFISEMGGVVVDKLDADVDYVVVGAGLTEARLDPETGRLYLKGEDAPATADEFYTVVRAMGLKVLREGEIPHFFGRD